MNKLLLAQKVLELMGRGGCQPIDNHIGYNYNYGQLFLKILGNVHSKNETPCWIDVHFNGKYIDRLRIEVPNTFYPHADDSLNLQVNALIVEIYQRCKDDHNALKVKERENLENEFLSA